MRSFQYKYVENNCAKKGGPERTRFAHPAMAGECWNTGWKNFLRLFVGWDEGQHPPSNYGQNFGEW
jgi:hypothetical protein